MASIKIHAPIYWMDKPVTQKQKSNTWNKFIAKADGHAKNMTSLFTVALVAQCALFIPLPVMLMFYFYVPVSILAITIALFFANIIACIAGSGTRTITSVFGLLVIDLFMLVVVLA